MGSEAGRLGRNFAAIVFGQLLTLVLTLAVSIVLARTLGVEQYGIFVFGFAFPSWLLLLVSLGLDSVLTIDVAADKSRAKSYLTAIAVLRIPLVLVAGIALWVSVQFILSDPFARAVTLTLGLSTILATYAGTFVTVFRAYERLGFTALLTVTERVVTAVATVLLLLLGFGLLEISIVHVLGSTLTLVLAIIIVKRSFAWFEKKPDVKVVRKILKRTAPFALAAVVSTVMVTSGPVLAGILRDLETTGRFNAAFALILALLTPMSFYGTVFLPTMSRLHGTDPSRLSAVLQKSQKLFFTLGLPVALGGWFYAREIVTLVYGVAFLDSARSFEVLVFVIATSTAALGMSTALKATNRQTLNLLIAGIGAAINIGLCIALIPVWGHVGAAYAFLISSSLSAFLTTAAVQRLAIRVNLRETLPRSVVAGITMTAFLLLLPRMPLWLGVPAGGLIYFTVLFSVRGITREDVSVIRSVLRGIVGR